MDRIVDSGSSGWGSIPHGRTNKKAHMRLPVIIAIIVALSCEAPSAIAQTRSLNASEAAALNLPDPLVFNNGKRVRNARQWTNRRRQEVLDIFSEHMYGKVPAAPEGMHFKTISEETVYDGLATRRTVRIFLDASEEHWFDMLMHVPNNVQGRIPMFAGMNFWGNNETIEGGRNASRWPYEMILKSGFGVVTAWRDDIQKDNVKVVEGGLREWYNTDGEWGHISEWAWALSRMMDYLETDPQVDAKKVAVMGCSRLGKTALWAGANDTRFALVISNCSGCCGAAISRRKKGETFNAIAKTFPYWFVRDFQDFKGREDEFPADQHWLAALIAPRPLYISSAVEDGWADPEGEWLCAHEAGPVYALFRKHTVGEAMPGVDSPDFGGDVGYHMRSGKHGTTAYDWEQYIAFTRRHFGM